jgi:LL-diaminopimelate aminotransferase
MTPTDLTAAPTERLTSLPIYVFAWLDELKAAARARGAELTDLGIGNPDRPTPQPVLDVITKAYNDPRTHGYPPFRGAPRFLDAVAGFMQRRFGVTVDPAREVLCLSGGKEGIAHLTMAYTDDRSISLVPDIYYPVHGRATMLAGGRAHFMPLHAASGFLPDFDAIPASVLPDAKLLLLNYPHNPTGAVATREFYEKAVAFARRHGIVLVSDLAYSELTFDGFTAPSVLEIPGARDVAVEFHSCSKSFNMAGSRIGFAVGNPELIDALYGVRTNMGYGTPVAIQEGAAYAFDHSTDLTANIAATYQSRRDVLVAGLRSLGWTLDAPRGTMFVWARVPAGYTSQEWSEQLVNVAGVVVAPGHAFGPGGEGYFRLSLVADETKLGVAIARLRDAGVRYSG